MAKKKVSNIVLRPKRQVTLPGDICEQLGIQPGDMLELMVEDSVLVARPKKKISMEALEEIRQAFQRSGITEEELLLAGRKVRQEVAREKYGSRV
jgi:AbrB family looped-hinge helix DNA binding protein